MLGFYFIFFQAAAAGQCRPSPAPCWSLTSAFFSSHLFLLPLSFHEVFMFAPIQTQRHRLRHTVMLPTDDSASIPEKWWQIFIYTYIFFIVQSRNPLNSMKVYKVFPLNHLYVPSSSLHTHSHHEKVALELGMGPLIYVNMVRSLPVLKISLNSRRSINIFRRISTILEVHCTQSLRAFIHTGLMKT